MDIQSNLLGHQSAHLEQNKQINKMFPFWKPRLTI